MPTGLKAIGAVFGALFGLIAAALIVGGAALLWAWGFGRDDAGEFVTSAVELETAGHAIVSEEIHLGAHPGDWIPAGSLADVRIEVTSSGSDEVFIGVADTAAVQEYLADVEHSRVTRIDSDDVTYRTLAGSSEPATPASEDLWEVSALGEPPLSLEWDLGSGTWTLVTMNGDGSAPVDVTMMAAAGVGFLAPAGIAILLVGLLLGLAAAGILVAVFASRESAADEPRSVPGRYPLVIEGDLDPDLNRGLWLIKWLLVVPHLVVLAFLWIGLAFSTVIAGISILFTRTYPRSIFDFNVGVLRWTWRVGFYGFDTLGTDRYPPFTLSEVSDYPARLDVEYPGELSQGLVLVKWWLLALPHYLIVGLFANGLVWWGSELGSDGNAVLEIGGGLISVLTIVAGVGLLVTGRYPRPVFDLLMGLNRWVYRVLAYVALMTDEYPPFRLDQGGSEPTPAPDSDMPGGPGTESLSRPAGG